MDELVKEYNFTYKVVKAGIDEKAIRYENPKELVVQLGYAKAEALMQRQTWDDTDQYLITGDQVVVHNDRILEKPESEDEVRKNVEAFVALPAKTVGSVVCTHWPTKAQLHHIDIATIFMNRLPDNVIEQLIAEGDVFLSAGGLLAEHPLVSPHVTKIEGGLDAIMGLSKNTVMSLLVQLWQQVGTHQQQHKDDPSH